MIVTKLKPPKIIKNTLSSFGGINKNPNCPENCFFDTLNTSSSSYPLVSTREKRKRLCTFTQKPSAIHTVNGLTLTVGNKLYYNGIEQFDGLSVSEKKQIVSMGSYVIIFPDGYYINTQTVGGLGVCVDRGYLAVTNDLVTSDVEYIPCLYDRIPTVSPTEPPTPNDTDLWLDNSSYYSKLYIYSSENGGWSPIAPTHVCIKARGIERNLNVGDNIVITRSIINVDGTKNIVAMGDGYIIVSGQIDGYTFSSCVDNPPLLVERKIPELDFVCEHQNRLFGCKYGKNENGDFVNEIYASKLGDPKNWNSFLGLSTDSYAASCGSEGKWTGICSHMGYVVFFKENKIHRLFGSKPSNFTLYQDEYDGVKLGSEGSLCLLNGSLFYHSQNGVYEYSGSAPSCVSHSLGREKYENASAGICNNIYYIALTDKNGERVLYTYDTQNRTWNKEDCQGIYLLEGCDGNLFSLSEQDGTYYLDLMLSSNVPAICRELYSETMADEEDFEWYAESGNIGLSLDGSKFVNHITLRLESNEGASVSLFTQTDQCGLWEECGHFSSKKLSKHTFDILAPRCDHFKIRLQGRGGCKIHSLTKVIESSSEVF